MMICKERPYQVTPALRPKLADNSMNPSKLYYSFTSGSTMTGGDKITEISTLITSGTHEDISNEDIDYDTSTRVC